MTLTQDLSLALTEENQGDLTQPISAIVISQTPGRLRFRLLTEYGKTETINKLADQLKEKLEIYRVRTNIQTGSITIFYGTNCLNFEHISIFIQQLGVNFIDNSRPTVVGENQSNAAATITRELTLFNRKIRQATNGDVDLRFLVPLGFSVLAVRQLLVKGIALDIIPWYVLAWYAFDSFIKLHYTRDIDQS